MSTLIPTNDTPLITPSENPSGEVVIYDGRCKFCTGMVKNLASWDRSGRRLAFLSLHDAEVARRYPTLTYDQLMKEMYVIDRRGRFHRGAEAFRYLTTRLPRLYVLAPLVHIPFSLPIWRWAYRQVAKRRYRIMGKTHDGCDGEACKIHFK